MIHQFDSKKLSDFHTYAEKKAQVEKERCYICNGRHNFKNCPDLKSRYYGVMI